jgi:hypothetical protein
MIYVPWCQEIKEQTRKGRICQASLAPLKNAMLDSTPFSSLKGFVPYFESTIQDSDGLALLFPGCFVRNG